MSLIQNNSSYKLQCSLHNQPFTLYCDRCMQPVCQKCTFIGPHNTSLHSLTPFHQAYQRRVQQLNTRLAKLSQTRDTALNKITQISSQIQLVKLQCQQITTQNDKNRSQLQQKLQTCYQNIISGLSAEQEYIVQLLNDINDLGHQFEELSVTNDIDCLINFQRIMDQLREVYDKLDALLQKNVQVEQLPKQLSNMRIKLKQIQTYEQLYKHKTQTIRALIKKLNQQVKKIESPKINYQQKLKQINHLLQRFKLSYGQFSTNLQNPNLRKSHFVCHFCGIIMDDLSINTSCTKNQISQQVKTTEDYYSYGSYSTSAKATNTSVNLSGYCKKQPDPTRFGTHRHYFGEPGDVNTFFRVAYLRLLLGKEVLGLFASFLSPTDSNLQAVNQGANAQNNSFANYLQLLFVKILTLVKIKGKDIQKLFQKEDIGKKTGYCEVVAMQYLLIQVIGLTEQETGIIVDISKFDTGSLQQLKQKKLQVRNYEKLIDKLNHIKIG